MSTTDRYREAGLRPPQDVEPEAPLTVPESPFLQDRDNDLEPTPVDLPDDANTTEETR